MNQIQLINIAKEFFPKADDIPSFMKQAYRFVQLAIDKQVISLETEKFVSSIEYAKDKWSCITDERTKNETVSILNIYVFIYLQKYLIPLHKLLYHIFTTKYIDKYIDLLKKRPMENDSIGCMLDLFHCLCKYNSDFRKAILKTIASYDSITLSELLYSIESNDYQLFHNTITTKKLDVTDANIITSLHEKYYLQKFQKPLFDDELKELDEFHKNVGFDYVNEFCLIEHILFNEIGIEKEHINNCYYLMDGEHYVDYFVKNKESISIDKNSTSFNLEKDEYINSCKKLILDEYNSVYDLLRTNRISCFVDRNIVDKVYSIEIVKLEKIKKEFWSKTRLYKTTEIEEEYNVDDLIQDLIFRYKLFTEYALDFISHSLSGGDVETSIEIVEEILINFINLYYPILSDESKEFIKNRMSNTEFKYFNDLFIQLHDYFYNKNVEITPVIFGIKNRERCENYKKEIQGRNTDDTQKSGVETIREFSLPSDLFGTNQYATYHNKEEFFNLIPGLKIRKYPEILEKLINELADWGYISNDNETKFLFAYRLTGKKILRPKELKPIQWNDQSRSKRGYNLLYLIKKLTNSNETGTYSKVKEFFIGPEWGQKLNEDANNRNGTIPFKRLLHEISPEDFPDPKKK